jgi:nucleotide-binding universal stress UspA family protein
MKVEAIKRILCATDFSKESEKAIEFAASMALEIKDSELILINVIKPIPAFSGDLTEESQIVDSENDIKRNSEEKMMSLIRDIQNSGVKNVRGLVVIGDPAFMIVQESDKSGASLIVLGTRKHGFKRGIILGSVSERVSANSPVSVLIVR